VFYEDFDNASVILANKNSLPRLGQAILLYISVIRVIGIIGIGAVITPITLISPISLTPATASQ
jgi:hypothetical protein